MSTTLPAIRGKFGSTEYYVVTMKSGELSSKLRMPKDIPEWEEMTIEERFQREINFKRVRDHIAPYLANDKDRFFGAMVVDIFNSEGVTFEALTDVVPKGLPGLYNNAAQSFGFLHFRGGEVLVPLDGQHRLAAIRFAIDGKDERQRPIPNLTPSMEVAEDDVTVILVRHDPAKARKIFNKINRYAKATSKAENLITADDDIVAVIVREEIVNNLVGERLVNYVSNTLSASAPEFTTLSTLYDATLEYLQEVTGERIDTTTLPSKEKQNLFRDLSKRFWETLLSEFTLFQAALADRSEAGDNKRREIRRDFLPGKPICQLAIVLAISRMISASEPDGKRRSVSAIVKCLNKIDWSVTNKGWQNILMSGDRVVTGKTAARFAARMIAYMAGEKLSGIEMEALLEQFASRFPQDERDRVELPRRVC